LSIQLPVREAPVAPPKNNLVRLLIPGDGIERGLELREASGAAPMMFGHFAVYNRWTEIDSFFEGNFMERFVEGAFKKTFSEDRGSIKPIFQHGRDMMIGMKPLGPVETLREEKQGAYYEVPLVDAPYARETLLPGLRLNLYGASFKFRVIREEINEEPGRSSSNPNGIPERTVQEARLYEFGPVTFPAYADATAGVRSGTDDYFLEALMQGDPECVRAAAEFSREHVPFSVFIAQRLGVERAIGNGDGAAAADSEETSPPEEAERQMTETVQTLIDRGLTPEQVIAAVDAAEPADGAEGDAEAEREEQADDLAEEQDKSADKTQRATPDPAMRGTTSLLGKRKEPWRL
jgi:HK97 family phage prohead protease